MIADHEAKQRFDTISDMAAEIADLQKKLADMTAERNEQRTRAVKAQSQVRMLEAQLTNPKREVFTLSLTITRPEDRVKADNDLAKKLNEGWERFDSAFVANLGEPTLHLITLTRVAPIPAEPDQPVATVTVSTVKEAQTVDDTEPTLPVTRKTVPSSAIAITNAEPAAPTSALAIKPAASAANADAAFQADLNAALLDKAEEIKRTNPFYGYQPRSFRQMMEARPQP